MESDKLKWQWPLFNNSQFFYQALFEALITDAAGSTGNPENKLLLVYFCI